MMSEQIPPGGAVVEQVVRCLQRGWTLSNRGPGWYLQPQRDPDWERQPLPVADEVIGLLQQQGVIQVQQTYISAHVSLCANQEVLWS